MWEKLTFAHCISWDRSVENFHLLGHLIVCETIFKGTSHVKSTPWFAIATSSSAFGVQDNDRSDSLTPLLGWKANHRSFGDLRTMAG